MGGKNEEESVSEGDVGWGVVWRLEEESRGFVFFF
jgi:hypothetical protein